MFVMTTVILALALAGVAAVAVRTRAEQLDRIVELLRFSGDDGLAPATVEAGLDRIEARLTHSSSPVEVSFDQLAAAMDEMPTGAVVADSGGRIVLRNRVAQPYDGGRHGDALIEASVQNRLTDALRGEITDEELRLHGPPERTLFIVGSPLVLDGELIGAIVLVDDVSEQHRIDSVRRDFVANVSHELRTPVGALSLLAETLDGEDDPAVIQRFLGRIQEETARLSSLIDDLLDLSRIEGGVGERAEPVELGGVITEAIAGVREAAEHRTIRVVSEIPPARVHAIGDHGQLVSAVTNLLENAVKYSASGDEVVCRMATHEGETAIAVVDTGIGIPAKDQSRIFERFYRADRGRSSESGGTGLGLAIVRHVAVNHGGRVEVVSQEGVGSTFTVILPTTSVADAPGTNEENDLNA